MPNGFGEMGPLDFAGLGSTLGSGLYNIFGHAKSPMKAAEKYLSQVPGQLHQYYDPYVTAGREALPNLQQQFQGLISDPSALLSSIGGKFQQSPGYQWQLNQGLEAAKNAAAAGGMAGSPQHQQQAMTVAQGLANQDYYNYIDRALQNYLTGLGGEQNINQLGYGAATDLGSMLSQLLMNRAQLAYEGQAAKNREKEATASGLGGLFGGVGSLIAGLF